MEVIRFVLVYEFSVCPKEMEVEVSVTKIN